MTFLPVLLIVLAILILLAGLTFLIIGLIQRKKAFWISGAAGLFTAIILAVVATTILIKPLMNEMSNGFKDFDLKNRHLNNDFTNAPDHFDNPVDTSFADATSGFIEDVDNSPVLIRVFPKRDLLSLAVIEKVEKGEYNNTAPKAVKLLMHFDAAFNGTFLMTAYDSENKVLGSSTVAIDKKAGEEGHLNFAFPDEVNLADIKFCTLVID